MFTIAALALASLLLTGCDRWALSIGGDGLLFIGVVGDNNHQPGRFRVRAREADGATRILDVPASGQLRLGGLPAGIVELTLVVPDGCQVTSSNPRILMVSGDQPINAAFEVRCGA